VEGDSSTIGQQKLERSSSSEGRPSSFGELPSLGRLECATLGLTWKEKLFGTSHY